MKTINVGDTVFWVCNSCSKKHIRNAKISSINNYFYEVNIHLPQLPPEEMDYIPNYRPGSLTLNKDMVFLSPEEAFEDYRIKEIKKAEEGIVKAEKALVRAKNRLQKAKISKPIFEVTN